jgi:hypothetical protein
VTDTEAIRLGATPRMLICVCGEASGVPGAGEIVSLAAAGAASTSIDAAARTVERRRTGRVGRDTAGSRE